MKIAVILLTGLSLGIADRASAGDCELPSMVAISDPGASASDKMAEAAVLQIYQLCILEEFERRSDRQRFAGDDAFIESFRDSFQKARDLFLGRKSFPGFARIRERNDTEATKIAGYGYTTYMHLSEFIYLASQCSDPYCVPRLELQKFAARGTDPVDEAARIAWEIRAEPIDPWFVIGPISVARESTDLTGINLRRKLEDAVFAYDLIAADLNRAKQRLGEAIETRDSVLTPLEDAQQLRQDEMNALLARNGKDETAIRQGSAYKNLSAIIARSERRVGQLDLAITHVFETEGDREAGQKRIRELQDELEAILQKADAAQIERDALFETRLPDEIEDKAVRLRREIRAAADDIQRRKAIYNARVESAQQAMETQNLALLPAAAAKEAARKALKTWENNQALTRIIGVETADAKFVPATEEERQKLQSHIDRIRAEIRERQEIARDLNDKRGSARLAMLEAGEAANDANNRLRDRGAISLIAQAELEIMFAAYDLVKSAKGGPAAVLAEASRQLVMTAAFPPSYYDATKRKLSDYSLYHSAPRATELVDLDAHLTGAPEVKELRKYWQGLPFKVVIKSLEEKAGKSAIESAADSYLFAAADLPQANQTALLKSIWKREEELASVSKELAAMSGQAGKSAMVAHASKKFVEGLAKSIAKEAVKKGIAELVEGGALETYMEAQLKLAEAVAAFQHAGGLYWANQDALTVLEGMLDGLEAREVNLGPLVDERNDAFYVDAGYKIRIEIKKPANVEQSQLVGTLTLGGVELKRDTGTTDLVWTVPKDAVEKFDHDKPEGLALVMTVN